MSVQTIHPTTVTPCCNQCFVGHSKLSDENHPPKKMIFNRRKNDDICENNVRLDAVNDT